jgi:hypothetical protein
MHRNYNESPGEGFTWMSICSAHEPEYTDISCPQCMCGMWTNDKEMEEDNKLHKEDYSAWHKKHNAPNSETRQFLESAFPKLRGEPYKVGVHTSRVDKDAKKKWWKLW